MVRPRTLAAVATLALGCLPAFAPNLRPRGVHAGLGDPGTSESCMGCHVSEEEALALDGPAAAPIVADWMIEEVRPCGDCHRVRGGTRSRAVRDRLPPLAEVDRER